MSDVPTDLAAALADRYAVEREIGRGGMATVYLAHDRKHRRPVAVKVLRADLAATLGADRFLKEIEIAAGLSHPHILPLHDSGRAGDTLYYVMPFVQGESLRGLLTRRGALERAAALEITNRVAGALDYAHRQGVLHRDIKPENILMAEGHAVVADFGIAKAISTAGGATLTRTGFPLGTPGYMSPEQAAGLSDLDERTDVYSLACVCYEMLVGETPGIWLTDEAVRVGMFLDATPAHRARLDRLSGGTEQALARALAVRAADRFETPVAFARSFAAPSTPRRFDETEAVEVVRRAAALDGADDATSDDALTIGGVQRIAAEVGLPPERVRQAIRSLDRANEPDPVSPFLGAPTSVLFERVIDGEVPEEEFPGLIEEIRVTMGRDGHARAHGKSLSWTTFRTAEPGGAFDLEDMLSRSMEQDSQRVLVRIASRGGKTRIRITERFGAIAGGLYGGLMGGLGGGGTGISIGVLGGALGLPWVVAGASALGLVVGSWGLARAIYTSVVGRKTRELRELFTRLEEYVEETVRSPTPT